MYGNGWLLMMKTALVYCVFELWCAEVVGWWAKTAIDKDVKVTAIIHRDLSK